MQLGSVLGSEDSVGGMSTENSLSLYPSLVLHRRAWQSGIMLTAEKYEAWWTFALQEQAI